tara:strand:- start:34 stop:633 length:600 start_codon:yes stop_codon:yes gene_type:complete
MKKIIFLTFFVLLISCSKEKNVVDGIAEDVKHYTVGGMTIGDSLLDYMSEEKIKENVVHVYPDKKFIVSVYKRFPKNYDAIGAAYKSNDKTYKIYDVQGRIEFNKNIEGCYKKQNEIEKKLSTIFQKDKIQKLGIESHNKDNGSTYKQTRFFMESGDAATVACYHFPRGDYGDHLKINIISVEFQNYLINLKKEKEKNN